MLPFLHLLLAVCAFAADAAAAVSSTTVNVTVDNVVVHLSKSDKQLGELFHLDKRMPLTITCRAETSPAKSGQSQLLLAPGSFDWRKPGGNESLLTPQTGAIARTECSPDGLSCVSALVFRKPANADASAYECLVTPRHKLTNAPAAIVTATGTFLSRPLITLEVEKTDKYDLAVWSTDTVEITCKVEGNPPGDIRWIKQLDPSFNLTGNTTLVLSGLSYERDRGDLTCVSRNDFGANQATMFLRVRSPRAFVAPLVGIGIELLVMLVIVVAYEVVTCRRRKRLEEAAAGDAPEDGKTD